MKAEKSKLEPQQEQLDIPVVMHRFNEFINEYEINIAKEKAFLSFEFFSVTYILSDMSALVCRLMCFSIG